MIIPRYFTDLQKFVFYTTGFFTSPEIDVILSAEIRVMPGKERKTCVRLQDG
jgi:hypothetical protein